MRNNIGNYQPISREYANNNVYSVDVKLSRNKEKLGLAQKMKAVIDLANKAISLTDSGCIKTVEVYVIAKADDESVVVKKEPNSVKVPKEPLTLSVDAEQIGLRGEILENIKGQLIDLCMSPEEAERANISYDLLKNNECKHMDKVICVANVNTHLSEINVDEKGVILLDEDTYVDLTHNKNEINGLDGDILESIFGDDHSKLDQGPRHIYGSNFNQYT